jgi:Flp pilus assembly pilin Flp
LFQEPSRSQSEVGETRQQKSGLSSILNMRKQMRFITETLIRLYCWATEETAQTMAEYALILGMASVVAVALLITLSSQIGPFFTQVVDIFNAA